MSVIEVSEPVILHPGEGETIMIGHRTRCTFKVTGRTTQNHFGLFEFDMGAGATGARPHLHRHLTEILYVLEGEVLLLCGDSRVVGVRGSLAVVPPETPHAFTNAGSERAVILLSFCPAGLREEFFRGLAHLTRDDRQPSQDELATLMAQFDQEPVGEVAFP